MVQKSAEAGFRAGNRRFQMEGANSSNMGKISSRPTSMSKDSSSLDQGEKLEKLPMGPTISRPGPTLLMQAATAVNVVTSPTAPETPTGRTHEDHQVHRQKQMDAPDAPLVQGLALKPDRGDCIGVKHSPHLADRDLLQNHHPGHLEAACVEPAQPPINISATRIALEKVGQVLKSTVAYPVVVMMEDTWKNAWRRLVPTES